ncbi:MAG: hypothetical protein RL222_1917, partial [Bacteroidota bacterium]
MLNTPVLFLIFNRPDTTRQVFAKIREIQPRQLFIAADGPRNIPGEAEKCALTRKTVMDAIDWDCEVKTLFRTENLGCGVAPSQAISWFFEQVEQGIILEDDCLPDASFFTFCEELLNYYKDDTSVMHISGNNFQLGKKIGDGSYYFSQIPHSWGWATWRRVWKQFDWELTELDKFLDSNNHLDPYWIDKFKMVQKERPEDIWDYQYTFCIFNNHGKAILPNKNLVKNIGFNQDATHTKGELLYYNAQS